MVSESHSTVFRMILNCLNFVKDDVDNGKIL